MLAFQKPFDNYLLSDDWKGIFFYELSCTHHRDGQLMFGSYDDLYRFHADETPFVRITGR